MEMNDADKKKVVEILNEILEFELAGVVRYTHYSLMVYGYNRIPIISWLKLNSSASGYSRWNSISVPRSLYE